VFGFESDLTELEDSDKEPIGQPSPRRLRSKDRELEKSKGKEKEDPDATPVAHSKQRRKRKCEEDAQGTEVFEGATGRKLRVTPMRKAKGRVGTLKELDAEEVEEEERGEEEEEEEEEEDELQDDDEEQTGVVDEEEEDVQEEEEVDELISSASISPPPEPRGRRIPLRRRQKPRRTRSWAAANLDEENEGDDEEEEEEAEGEEQDDEGEGVEENEEEAVEEEDDEVTIAVEPRKLRNGKIVGEEDVEMDVDEEEEEEEEEGAEGEEEGEEEESVDGQDVDVDAEGETDEDEAMEDDGKFMFFKMLLFSSFFLVDLTIATAKTLVRMRRDDLVRLCETRDLDPSGTKPQLAEALLQWRDRQGNDFSSPSSAGTVRPSSNRRKRRTKHHSGATDTAVPILLRSEHTHTDEPRTPNPGKDKENEDLELDLESLGLEDREIPPEKITKLEKIGSGGFKDVYIGKLKSRKVAISEFRGQLSASELSYRRMFLCSLIYPSVDIKELKLLGAFNHPNIVRFVCNFCLNP
jgi:hypothetical protein